MLFLLAGCGERRAAAPPAAPPVAVAVASFGTGGTPADLVIPARVKAAEEVTLNARLSARLTALPAREGDRVRRGDPVALFATPEVRKALAAASADVASAEASVAVTARQAARMESLFATHVVAERDREVAAAEQHAAEARLAAARAALDALETGSTVRAPLDGVVVRVHADPGADLTPGAPIVDLRSTAGLEVIAEVPEAAVGRLATTPLAVQIGEGPWRPARITRLEGMTDWRSRSRTAHVAFDGAAEPGAYARLALAAHPDAAGGDVPATSLVERGALSGVFVVEDGHARLRWLQLGRPHAGRVQVLAGLEAGERFALSPGTLTDGVAVTVRP